MLSIIISSYQPKLYNDLEKNIAETCGVHYEIIRIENPNKMSITKAYNLGAEKAKFEHILFIHEDVKFHSKNWGKILESYYQIPNLGVFGIAGSKRKFNLPYGFYSGLKPENYVFLNHSGEKKGIHEQIDSPIKIKVIDGVFIGMNKSIWSKVRFNEDLKGFHFYDLDISLRTSNQYQNYLVNNIDFEHFSMGNFGNEWIKACISFNKNKEYNFDTYNPKEKRDVRNFWYKRLMSEKINLNNRIQYAIAMGNNKDTLKNCAKFLLNFK